MKVIINYGMGNTGSIQNMLKKIGHSSVISDDLEVIRNATMLILPGVGAFDEGVKNLQSKNIWNVLEQKVLEDKTPFLGICLGMQLLTEKSEEGIQKGLGFVKGRTIRFRKGTQEMLKIPHMGWNDVAFIPENPFGFNPAYRFYFVHSYHVEVESNAALAHTQYGNSFVSALYQNNIVGVQFHPEKSHRFGISFFETLMKYFDHAKG